MTQDQNGGAPDSGVNDQVQGNTGNAPDQKGEHMIPKSRFDQVVNQRKVAEAALEEIAVELAEEVPEDMRDVIPDLPPAQKIKWLRAAIKKGVFGGNQQANGPDSKRPGGKPPVNFDGMSPQAIMAQGYGKK
jgi:hypothetical protein